MNARPRRSRGEALRAFVEDDGRKELRDQVAELESRLSSMVSQRDLTIRDLRATLARVAQMVDEARLATKWVVDHEHRAHEYDRPYAKLALEELTAARDELRKSLVTTTTQPEAAVARVLDDDPYIISHYRDGDTGVIGWVCGAASVHLDRAGYGVEMSALREAAKAALDAAVAAR